MPKRIPLSYNRDPYVLNRQTLSFTCDTSCRIYSNDELRLGAPGSIFNRIIKFEPRCKAKGINSILDLFDIFEVFWTDTHIKPNLTRNTTGTVENPAHKFSLVTFILIYYRQYITCITDRPPTTPNLSYLELYPPRSVNVKCDSTAELIIYDLPLLLIALWHNSAPLRHIRLENVNDLDFDLSRSPNVSTQFLPDGKKIKQRC